MFPTPLSPLLVLNTYVHKSQTSWSQKRCKSNWNASNLTGGGRAVNKEVCLIGKSSFTSLGIPQFDTKAPPSGSLPLDERSSVCCSDQRLPENVPMASSWQCEQAREKKRELARWGKDLQTTCLSGHSRTAEKGRGKKRVPYSS